MNPHKSTEGDRASGWHQGNGPLFKLPGQNRALGAIPNTFNTLIAAPLVPRCSPSGHLGRVVGSWWLIWVKPAKTVKRVMSLNSSSRVLRIKDVFLSVCRRRTSAERVVWFRKDKAHDISGILS